MPSYRTYGLLIITPYLLLAITFHMHLQTYERAPRQNIPINRVTDNNIEKNNKKISDDTKQLMDSNLREKFNFVNFKDEAKDERVGEINPRFLLNHRQKQETSNNNNDDDNTNNNNNRKKTRTEFDDKYRGEKIVADNDINNKGLVDFNPLSNKKGLLNHDGYMRRGLKKKGHHSTATKGNQSKDDEFIVGKSGYQLHERHGYDSTHKRAAGYKLFPSYKGVKLPQSNPEQNDNIDNIAVNHENGKIVKALQSNSIIGHGKGKASQSNVIIDDGKGGGRKTASQSNSIIDQGNNNKDLPSDNEINAGFMEDKSNNLFEKTFQGLEGFSSNVTWTSGTSNINNPSSMWNSNFPIQDHCLNKPGSTVPNANVQFQALKGNHIYSAYLDDRPKAGPVVRIIALIQSQIRPQFFCHYVKPINAKIGSSWYGWIRPSNYETRNVQYYEMCENHGKKLGGWILTCDIPEYMTDSPPCHVIVSVHSRYDSADIDGNVNVTVFTTKPGANYTITYYMKNTKNTFNSNRTGESNTKFFQKSNNLAKNTETLFFKPKIRINLRHSQSTTTAPPPKVSPSTTTTAPYKTQKVTIKKTKQEFGICVPPLFGYIPSTTLIEFIELSKLLGADHIVFYVHEVSGEILRVLKFYRKQGAVSVIPWKIPADENVIWYHGQLLAINDCLYRSMHRFKYVAFNDLDEFIVPKQGITNWSDMVASFHRSQPFSQSHYSGYSFQSAFFDPLSSSARMLYDLESDLRTKAFSRVRSKVMVMPDRMYELGIHHISRPMYEGLQAYYVNTSVAYIHHYRQCVTDFDPKMNCQIYARDESLSHYIPTLRHNVHKATWLLKELEKKFEKLERMKNEKMGGGGYIKVRNI